LPAEASPIGEEPAIEAAPIEGVGFIEAVSIDAACIGAVSIGAASTGPAYGTALPVDITAGTDSPAGMHPIRHAGQDIMAGSIALACTAVSIAAASTAVVSIVGEASIEVVLTAEGVSTGAVGSLTIVGGDSQRARRRPTASRP